MKLSLYVYTDPLTVVLEIDAGGASVDHSVNEQQVENGHRYDDSDNHPGEL